VLLAGGIGGCRSSSSSFSENGSAASACGEASGVWCVDETALDAVLLDVTEAEWRPEACLWEDLPEGDARRERVLRKTDLRFGGAGREELSMGREGILSPGYASRSLPCNSTISNAVRVRVILWVGARGRSRGQ